VTELLYVLSLK